MTTAPSLSTSAAGAETLDAAIHRVVTSIHQGPYRLVLVTAGGGTSVPGLLLAVPGGSRTVLEASIPYHEAAVVQFLGHRPAQFTSAATSQALAVRALDRARWLAPGAAVLGVACTASLVSDKPKRGDHRFHISVAGDQARTCSVVLRKGARDREGEEAVVAAVLLNVLAEATGSVERVPAGLLPDEATNIESAPIGDPLSALVRGELTAICAEADGRLSVRADHPPVVVPGAFNPAHLGHWRLAGVAARITGKPVAFELSIVNVDKPPLAAEDVRRRLVPFAWHWDVWITRAPTFAEKASLFPGAVFVVGADTAERLVAARYYGDSEARMNEALEHIRRLGCRFLVAGREDRSGRFVSIDELPLPAVHRDLFTGIPEADFHVSISSTLLRERAREQQAQPTDND